MRDLDWRIIAELSKNPNLTQVAKLLYVTQPTLTKRLKHIEEEFDVQIVDRTPKGLVLTEEGTWLGEKADEYLEFRKSVFDGLDKLREKKTEVLHIGSAYTFSKYSLRELLDPFTEKYPNVQLRITNKQSDILYDMLLEGSIDAAFVRGDYVKGVSRIAMNPTYGYLMTKAPVRLEDLPGMNRLLYQTSGKTLEILDGWWQDWFGGTPYREGLSAGYIDFAIANLTGDDDYILCFLPRERAEEQAEHYGLTLNPLYLRDGTPLTRSTWFLYRKEKRISLTLERLISYVTKEAKKIAD